MEYYEYIPHPSTVSLTTALAEQVACDATWHDRASNFVAGTPFGNLYLED